MKTDTEILVHIEKFEFKKHCIIKGAPGTVAITVKINHLCNYMEIFNRKGDSKFIFKDPEVSKEVAELIQEATIFAKKRLEENINKR